MCNPIWDILCSYPFQGSVVRDHRSPSVMEPANTWSRCIHVASIESMMTECCAERPYHRSPPSSLSTAPELLLRPGHSSIHCPAGSHCESLVQELSSQAQLSLAQQATQAGESYQFCFLEWCLFFRSAIKMVQCGKGQTRHVEEYQ